MTYHHGNYIGGHSGISTSTRRLVVAELRSLAAKMVNDKDRAVLHARADEIEDAGAIRWDCGMKFGDLHPTNCADCVVARGKRRDQSANA